DTRRLVSVSVYPKSSGAGLRRVVALAALVVAGAWVGACDQPSSEAPPPVPDSVTVEVEPDSLVDSLTASSYDAALGEVLLVPVVGEGAPLDAVAVLSARLPRERPVGDTVGLRERLGDGRVELFARGGLVGERAVRWDATMVSASPCAAWPV